MFLGPLHWSVTGARFQIVIWMHLSTSARQSPVRPRSCHGQNPDLHPPCCQTISYRCTMRLLRP